MLQGATKVLNAAFSDTLRKRESVLSIWESLVNFYRGSLFSYQGAFWWCFYYENEVRSSSLQKDRKCEEKIIVHGYWTKSFLYKIDELMKLSLRQIRCIKYVFDIHFLKTISKQFTTQKYLYYTKLRDLFFGIFERNWKRTLIGLDK